MLVFGTQMHIVTFVFIVLEFCMFLFQLTYYLFRPQDKNRLWYLLLLFLMLVYNITGGLFPDQKIHIPISIQEMTAYGSGFLMASYFPFYFYKAFDLKSLRWHALYGVPLFLILSYIVFFVILYAINGDLNKDITLGMIAPFIYAMVLLWVMFQAIYRKYKINRDKNQYFDEIAMYGAVSPWAALTLFGFVEGSQLLEVLCTNTGIILITILFIRKSIKSTRLEYLQLQNISNNSESQLSFEENCVKYNLTKTEIQITQFLSLGMSNKEIAEKMHISEETVKKHIYHIYRKTTVKNRTSLLHKLQINSPKQ